MRAIVPFWPLIALCCALSAINASAVVMGVSPPENRLSELLAGLLVMVWIVWDARRRRCVPCYEFGFLVSMALPISLIWYLYWTRGWRGLMALVALFALLVVPSLVVFAVRMIVYVLQAN